MFQRRYARPCLDARGCAPSVKTIEGVRRGSEKTSSVNGQRQDPEPQLAFDWGVAGPSGGGQGGGPMVFIALYLLPWCLYLFIPVTCNQVDSSTCHVIGLP
eukprot:1181397-Prorocentrum_minimum.AAC.3